ncbi:hypothetical protein AYO21_09713 [Fonsecaea monophora]|uniref:HTH araC/xylS-type domain-containing protein n=1 Tax=Fonsecaea monophora TaxID=254056 RepID=A0A177EWU9_9EURO|nr:hypothetical protein AYO21_09713 [Fonsecaea monophora]OAG36086.1 hypothetical protein AYO21_09713 [Fonsecaea monophora]
MSARGFSSTTARWSAVAFRNSEAVGEFVYAVKTTGIYCRPDCKARLARRANVAFYDNGPLAEEAGYRACRRCKPHLLVLQQEDPLQVKIRHAVDLVQTTASRGQKISLQQLSDQVRLSKWHLQRMFKRLQGLSPHEMTNAIINATEAGTEGNQPSQSRSESVAQNDTERHSPVTDAQIESSRHPQDSVGLVQEGVEQYSDQQVDDVLRDLFPELYIAGSEQDAESWARA